METMVKRVYVHVDAHGNKLRNSSLEGLLSWKNIQSFFLPDILQEIKENGYYVSHKAFIDSNFIIYCEYTLNT